MLGGAGEFPVDPVKFRGKPPFLAGCLGLALGLSPVARAEPLAPVDCWFTVPADFKVACYRFQVPESRAGKSALQLSLPVAVISAPGERKYEDPVVYLAGGPGDGAWLDADRITWWWDFIDDNAWVRERDLVLVDQRGTGLTEPRMDCPELQAAAVTELGLGGDYAAAAKLNREATAACLKRVTAAGHDPTAYNTKESAVDLHDLFQALQRPKWNVYGLSYGTRFALTYMRDFPGDIRSVILDSVVPLQAHFFEDGAWVTDRAFRTLFAGCAADRKCRRDYPDLQSDLETLVQDLNARPFKTTRLNPLGDDMAGIVVTGDLLLGHLFSNLYNRADIENVPRIIEAFKQRRLKAMDQEIDYMLDDTLGRDDFGEGLWTSASCLEEAPFNDLKRARAAYAAYPMLKGFAAIPDVTDACDLWAQGSVDPADGRAVESDIPSLILSGAYDPVTPPQYARLAAAGLHRSFYFEFPGAGHDVLGNEPCADALAGQFLDNPEIMPTHPCLGQLTAPDFAAPEK